MRLFFGRCGCEIDVTRSRNAESVARDLIDALGGVEASPAPSIVTSMPAADAQPPSMCMDSACQTEERLNVAAEKGDVDTAQNIDRRFATAESEGEVAGGNRGLRVRHEAAMAWGPGLHKETRRCG